MQATTQTKPHTDRILRMSEICERSTLSRATIYRFSKKGAFPKLIKLGANSTGLPESAFLEWMQSRTVLA